MTKNEFYNTSDRLRKASRRLLRVKRRLIQISSMQTIKANVGSEVQNNNTNSMQEALIAEKLDLEKEQKELESVIAYDEKELNRYINKVDNDTYRDLLYYKYIKNLKWYDIADIIGYTIDHTKGYIFRSAKKELFKTF